MATARKASTESEADLRVRILNSFMTCPHRDTEKILEVHRTIQEKDPLF